MENLQEQIEKEKAKGNEVAALQEGLENLGKVLTQQPQQVQQSLQRQPGESEEEFHKRFNDAFYDDPFKMMNEYSMRKIAPELQRLAQTVEAQAKRTIRTDSQRKETYEKYKDEIDVEYSQTPQYERFTDPDAYQKAHDRVVARHINEIIDERVKARLESGGEKPKPKQAPSYSEAGYTPVPKTASKPRQVRLTTGEQRWAVNSGLTLKKAAEILQRNPDLRKRIGG
jgi:hypothetical protein